MLDKVYAGIRSSVERSYQTTVGSRVSQRATVACILHILCVLNHHHYRNILDVGYWVLYAQILMTRVGALLCSRNEQADLTTLCPIWIQMSEH